MIFIFDYMQVYKLLDYIHNQIQLKHRGWRELISGDIDSGSLCSDISKQFYISRIYFISYEVNYMILMTGLCNIGD